MGSSDRTSHQAVRGRNPLGRSRDERVSEGRGRASALVSSALSATMCLSPDGWCDGTLHRAPSGTVVHTTGVTKAASGFGCRFSCGDGHPLVELRDVSPTLAPRPMAEAFLWRRDPLTFHARWHAATEEGPDPCVGDAGRRGTNTRGRVHLLSTITPGTGREGLGRAGTTWEPTPVEG